MTARSQDRGRLPTTCRAPWQSLRGVMIGRKVQNDGGCHWPGSKVSKILVALARHWRAPGRRPRRAAQATANGSVSHRQMAICSAGQSGRRAAAGRRPAHQGRQAWDALGPIGQRPPCVTANALFWRWPGASERVGVVSSGRRRDETSGQSMLAAYKRARPTGQHRAGCELRAAAVHQGETET